MLKKIEIAIEGNLSQNDKILLETEIDVLEGIKDVGVDYKKNKLWIEFEDLKISEEAIAKAIKKLGYRPKTAAIKKMPALREHIYYVKGMYCASCELIIEKKLLAIEGVKSVQASTSNGEVLVEYEKERPAPEKLNKIFKKDNYLFSDQPLELKTEPKKNEWLIIFGIALLVIIGFYSLNKSGLAGLINVSSKSSLPTFFIFGLLAGISSCAALVGGMVLSMSKQWLNLYSDKNTTTFQKLQPHFLFNVGRLISYAILGAALGVIGSRLQISFRFTSLLIIAISVMMVFLALQMLGVRAFQKFQLTLPKSISRYIADETNFKGRYLPFIMGALTFFLPCGFTITAQGLALLSGNPAQGALIMFLFALGTTPTLLFIGLSSVKFSSRPHLAYRFAKVAGILVLFFALFNINNQLNVLGYVSLNNFNLKPNQSSDPQNTDSKDLAPIVDGKQILKMDALASGYNPNYFKVRTDMPVKWEITDRGTSGCTNAVISNGLFSGEIDLKPGQVSIKEFTPAKTGKYKFSCWMGMISGIIEVISSNGSSLSPTTAAAASNDAVIPSGAKGCGCGGGNGSTCAARANPSLNLQNYNN